VNERSTEERLAEVENRLDELLDLPRTKPIGDPDFLRGLGQRVNAIEERLGMK
jgi:hypothetical protein